MDRQHYLMLWLQLLHGWNPPWSELCGHLRAHCPDSEPWEAPPDTLAVALDRLANKRAAGSRTPVAADLRWLEDGAERRILPITDPCYPWLLRHIADPPLVLFVDGDPACLDQPSLAVVGSRSPTPQGREIARDFGRALGRAGFVIVSGLARGIDGAAHQGTLEKGRTVAVCGHGLDSVYPAAHRRLGEAIRKQGALISEFPTGTPPRRPHFPRRNRLISGLCLGTLVVEAGMQSGSLITARLAAEQNREVFAVPGSIHSPQSRGCHSLIRKGATLVESVHDILAELGHFSDRWRQTDNGGSQNSGHGHDWFLQHMGYAPCTPDELVNRSGLTSAEVSSMLLRLELEGCVEMCPGGSYVRVNRS